jgi:hypothetical protein
MLGNQAGPTEHVQVVCEQVRGDLKGGPEFRCGGVADGEVVDDAQPRHVGQSGVRLNARLQLLPRLLNVH